jgi:hypothetical protein
VWASTSGSVLKATLLKAVFSVSDSTSGSELKARQADQGVVQSAWWPQLGIPPAQCAAWRPRIRAGLRWVREVRDRGGRRERGARARARGAARWLKIWVVCVPASILGGGACAPHKRSRGCWRAGAKRWRQHRHKEMAALGVCGRGVRKRWCQMGAPRAAARYEPRGGGRQWVEGTRQVCVGVSARAGRAHGPRPAVGAAALRGVKTRGWGRWRLRAAAAGAAAPGGARPARRARLGVRSGGEGWAGGRSRSAPQGRGWRGALGGWWVEGGVGLAPAWAGPAGRGGGSTVGACHMLRTREGVLGGGAVGRGGGGGQNGGVETTGVARPMRRPEERRCGGNRCAPNGRPRAAVWGEQRGVEERSGGPAGTRVWATREGGRPRLGVVRGCGAFGFGGKNIGPREQTGSRNSGWGSGARRSSTAQARGAGPGCLTARRRWRRARPRRPRRAPRRRARPRRLRLARTTPPRRPPPRRPRASRRPLR